jgi:threonine aldolase
MRQVGILAAGALYALEHHRSRLADDHANARRLAERLAAVEGVRVLGDVETNIVHFEVGSPADAVAREARALGVLVAAPTPRAMRAVTHLDVGAQDSEAAADAIAVATRRAGRS